MPPKPPKRHSRSNPPDALLYYNTPRKDKRNNGKPPKKPVCGICKNNDLLEEYQTNTINPLLDQIEVLKASIGSESESIDPSGLIEKLEESSKLIKDNLITLNDLRVEILSPRKSPTVLPSASGDLTVKHDFIEDTAPLLDFVKTLEFKDLGSRETYYAGDFDYTYGPPGNEVTHPAAEIPEFLKQNVIDILPLNEGERVNSILINKYVGGKKKLNLHPDNEKCLSPWMSIYNISLDETRTMRVSNMRDKSIFEDIILRNGTLNIMTRQMQNEWLHGIMEDNSTGTRYSITIRLINPEFLNATLIVGDSLCHDVMFGTEKQTLGSKCPGTKVNSYKVDDLPNASFMASFPNVIIHTGINNLLNKSNIGITSPQQIVDGIKNRCAETHALNPECRFGISTVIPTCDPEAAINDSIYNLNHKLWLFTAAEYNSSRFVLINNNFMGSWKDGKLREVFRCDNKSDPIHTGPIGASALGLNFKQFIRRTGIYGPVRNRSKNKKRGVNVE